MAAASSSVARCLLRSHPRENLTRWTTGRLLRHCISIACSWFFRFVARSRCRWEHTHTHQCRLHLRSPSIQLTELWNFVGCGAPWPASTRSQTGAFIGRWPPIFRFWLIQTACSVGIWCGSLFTPPPSFAFIRRAAKILCFFVCPSLCRFVTCCCLLSAGTFNQKATQFFSQHKRIMEKKKINEILLCCALPTTRNQRA